MVKERDEKIKELLHIIFRLKQETNSVIEKGVNECNTKRDTNQQSDIIIATITQIDEN